jgi:hypothetical protein
LRLVLRVHPVTLTLDAWVCLATAFAAWLLAWTAWEVEIPAANAGAAANMIAMAAAIAV